MTVTKLQAFRYRNIEDAEIPFSPGVNLILGENAQGKTNALEAVYTFARGKSFRGAKDAELCLFGEKSYRIAIGFHDGKREQTLAIRYENGEKTREQNGVRLEKQTEMLGQFRAVLFCPEHLNMVKEGPDERRQFLNIAISQCRPAYLALYADYNRYLENRNALLKFGQKGYLSDTEEIDAWSRGLAKCAAAIYAYRAEYVRRLAPYAAEYQQLLSGGKETLEVSYESDVKEPMTKEEAEIAYLSLFRSNIGRECQMGFTQYGVHRDDLSLVVNGKSVREYGSQGQQRTTVLALKLAEGEVCRETVGEEPVYLFDDVLSELDESRRAVMVTESGRRQYLITACDKSVYRGDANCITAERGHYVSAYR